MAFLLTGSDLCHEHGVHACSSHSSFGRSEPTCFLLYRVLVLKYNTAARSMAPASAQAPMMNVNLRQEVSTLIVWQNTEQAERA